METKTVLSYFSVFVCKTNYEYMKEQIIYICSKQSVSLGTLLGTRKASIFELLRAMTVFTFRRCGCEIEGFVDSKRKCQKCERVAELLNCVVVVA